MSKKRSFWSDWLYDVLLLVCALAYADFHAVHLVIVGVVAFLGLMSELRDLTDAVREMPGTRVNVYDQRTTASVDRDEWKGGR